jgi:peptide/nickel transport system permease protein
MPSEDYWFGTDDLGRDIFSRVLYGARASLRVAILATIISGVLGTLLGLVSGWWGGLLDNVIMRVMDALLAFPTIVLALGIIAVLGTGMNNAMLAIGIVGTPVFARLVRSQILTMRERPFVEAARALGRPEWGIIWRHSLPNVVPVIIVQASLRMAEGVLAESALSFLGMGVQPPTPSLGMMLNDARGFMLHAPWTALAPGLTIFLAVLCINMLGDSLRDVLDPRLRGQAYGPSFAGE